MSGVRNMIFLILLDVKRVFRDMKYVFFIIALPMLFYIVYTAIFLNNANVNGAPWSEYCLISMISFGIMGDVVNLLGTKVADERGKKWYAYIQVSPVNYFYYGLSHISSYLTISLFLTFLMLVLAFFYKDTNLGLVLPLKIGLVLNLASVVFLMLALLAGRLGSLSQPIGTILYLMLSFLGGLWMLVTAMPKFLSHLAVLLLSYSYVKLGWCLLAHKRLVFNSVGSLLAYFVISTLLYVYLQKREQMNQKELFMEIKEYFGDILEFKKRLAAQKDLPFSAVIDEKSPKDISLIFGNYPDKEVIDFFETNFHPSYRHIIGYKQGDGYGDILAKCDYKSILCFKGIGDKVYAYSSDMTVPLKNRLYEVEELSRFYVRISKLFVVNILAVEKILPALNGKILIALSDGQELAVTRKYKKQFLEYLEA